MLCIVYISCRNHTKIPPIWWIHSLCVASSAAEASPVDGAQLCVCIWMRVLVAQTHGSECTDSWCPRSPEAASRRVAWHGIRVERHWFYIMSSQRVATLSTHSGAQCGVFFLHLDQLLVQSLDALRSISENRVIHICTPLAAFRRWGWALNPCSGGPLLDLIWFSKQNPANHTQFYLWLDHYSSMALTWNVRRNSFQICWMFFYISIWENVSERGGPSKKHMKGERTNLLFIKFNKDFQSRFFFTASWATAQLFRQVRRTICDTRQHLVFQLDFLSHLKGRRVVPLYLAWLRLFKLVLFKMDDWD